MSALRRLFAVGRLRVRPAAALLLLGVFTLGLTASSDGDIWWHLAAGREMVARQGLLHEDPFSVSAGGRPWPDVHWLFQLGVYAVHRLGGLGALVFVKSAALAAGAALLLASVVARGGARLIMPFALTFLLALLAVRDLLLLRPVIVSLVLLAYFFFALERARSQHRLTLLLPLPLLQVVWSNVQGLFALGPALVATYAVASALSARFAERRWFIFAGETQGRRDPRSHTKALTLTALACSLAALVTPFGSSAARLPLALLMRLLPATHNVFSVNVAENVPPLAASAASGAGQFWHLPWFLLALCATLIASWRRLPLSHFTLLVALAGLALMANRNVLLLYWLATPIALISAAPLLRWGAARARLALGSLAPWPARASLAAVLLITGNVAAKEPSLAEPTPFHLPVNSARMLAQTQDRASIFAADHYGGYLIWSLYPEKKPYIDTRLILRTAEEYREFLGVVAEPGRFQAFAARHGFGYVLLPSAYPDRYLGLIAQLTASAEWKLVYTDGSETLFARRDSDLAGWDLTARDTTKRIVAELELRFARSQELRDAARTQLGTLQLAAGALDEAEYVLSGTSTREAETLMARARLLRGDFAGARAISERLLRTDPDDVQNLNLQATAALALADPAAAKAALSRVFRLDPFDSDAENILRRLEDEQHEKRP